MKRLICTAVIAATALSAHAQGIRTVLDKRAKDYQQDLGKVEADIKKQQDTWPDQYMQALKSLDQSFTEAGNLDNVLLVRKEIERFKQSKQVPEDAIVPAPKDLANLQTRAAKMPQVVELSRRKQVTAVTDKYIAGLEDLKKELTKQGKIEDALKVNEELGLVRSRTQTSETVVEPPSPPQREPDAVPEPVAGTKPPTPAAAQPANRAGSPIGKWRSHPPDQPDIHLTMALHEDGRFEVQGDDEWSGTWKFLNDERTKVERTCRNGIVFILEYNAATDEMMQDDGAPYRRFTD